MGYSSVQSARKLFTGLAIAAFMVCTLKVISAITSKPKPHNANTHQLMVILYANPSSHLYIIHHATGVAITKAINTSCTKSFDKIEMILVTVAPSIFLIPISFVRVLMVYITSPNKPRQLMNTDKPVAQPSKLAVRCSVS